MKGWLVTIWTYRDRDGVVFTTPVFEGVVNASAATLAIHYGFKRWRRSLPKGSRVSFATLKAKAVRA